MAAALQEGRSGMAALITGRPEDTLDDETVRTVGSVQMALMSGVMIQWLVDPAHAPSAEQIAAGLRALARPTTPPPPPLAGVTADQFTSVQALASSRRVSPSNCGSTFVRPMTGMKLPSPPHRGTTC